MCVNQLTSLTASDQQWAAHSCHTAALYTPAVSDQRLAHTHTPVRSHLSESGRRHRGSSSARRTGGRSELDGIWFAGFHKHVVVLKARSQSHPATQQLDFRIVGFVALAQRRAESR